MSSTPNNFWNSPSAEEQLVLMQAILDASQNVMAYCVPMRNEEAQIVDFSYRIANQGLAQLLGIERSQILEKPLMYWFPNAKELGLFQQYVDAIETKESRIVEFPYGDQACDGCFLITATPLQEGIVLSFVDITDQKRARVAQQEQAELLQATLDASLNSTIAMRAIRDESGQIIDFLMQTANRAVERDLFLPPEKIAGHRLLEVFPGNIESGLFGFYQRVAETGQTDQTTQYYIDANGLEAWFTVAAVRQSTDQIVITFMNITESKLQELRLKKSNEDLVRSNELLEQFAYGASHDLQEPLRKIQAFGDLLLDQYGSQLGDGATVLQRMQSAASRMSGLIQDLLTYSRLSTQKPAPVAVSLNPLINDVLSDLELMIQDKNAVVEVAPLPTIRGSVSQLRQLFQNLLINALKFSFPNTPPHIQISTREVRLGDLPAGLTFPILPVALKPLQKSIRFYEISVQDNGIGFKTEYRHQIFKAFQRLHSQNSQYAGTGLGLAIVKKVVENHFGAILAESREGQGAVFRIFLPTGV
ncbi:sensor histidine kinase [Larkinella sp. GY13]|uniref:sensor histidine kinase n=1 Tax=Larkinella sp. GY13 TaxID=3453720 RepID=UPI003EECDCCF